MKWTTANVKNPSYTHNHEIFVGTQTGSFKKLSPTNQENAFVQHNLSDLSKLDKDSRVTTLSFNADKTEIWLGRGGNSAELHSLQTHQLERTFELKGAPVVGLACYDKHLVAGFGNGKIQCLSLEDSTIEGELISAGDEMVHLRQCPTQRSLVATGGNGRQNNLKVFDMEAGGKQVFTSKNVPNDFLQLEVPVWDSDVGFIDQPHMLATCSRHGYVRVFDTRKQRRPVQLFSTDEHMSFTSLAAHDNYIYTGTTTGSLKAFDIRRMKTFVHTYKGFTGGITDLHLDNSGKYLASSSLDRYVRVHDVNSCVLLYQCYVKSKASRVLIRETVGDVKLQADDEQQEDDAQLENTETNKKHKRVDKEYEDMFDNMQTICETDENVKEATTDKANKRKKDSSKNSKNKKLKK